MYQPNFPAHSQALPGKLDLAAYASSLRAAGHAEFTTRAYISRVQIFAEYCSAKVPSECHPAETLNGFTSYLRDQLGYRPNSIRASITAVRSYLQCCGHGDVRYKSPSVSETEPPSLSSDEEHQMWCAVEATRSAKFRAVVALILSTGIRPGELRDARVSAVKFTSAGASIEIAGKTGTRIIPLGDEIALYLLEWLAIAAGLWRPGQHDPLLFANHGGRKLSYTAINAIVKVVARKAHLNASGRTLRNTFVKRVLESEKDKSKAAYLVGCSGSAPKSGGRDYRG